MDRLEGSTFKWKYFYDLFFNKAMHSRRYICICVHHVEYMSNNCQLDQNVICEIKNDSTFVSQCRAYIEYM